MTTSELMHVMADRLGDALDKLAEGEDDDTNTVLVTARIPGVGKVVLTFETFVYDDEQAGE